MELARLRAFEAEILAQDPKFKVAFKDETPWMKVVAFFAMPFNSKFMTGYISTFGHTVYFPSRASYEGTPKASFTVLAHELVHIKDSVKYPGWFQLSYALPQALALIPLIAYGFVHHGWIALGALVTGLLLGCWAAKKSVAFFFLLFGGGVLTAGILAILLTHGWSWLLFAGLVLGVPLPSPWRTKWELRGYTMNLAVMQWTYGPPPQIIRDMMGRHFYGPDYYYMSWTKTAVDKALNLGIERAQNGALLQEEPYNFVYKFLASQKELRE